MVRTQLSALLLGLLIVLSGCNAATGFVDEFNGTPKPGFDEGYNKSLVESEFIVLLNEERSRRGLQNVSQRDTLTEMGENHSQNMVEHDYFGHVQPDGDTIEDRYEKRGLLPECELPKEGTRRYYPGAENAYTGHVDTRTSNSWSEKGYISVYSEEELARAIFESWMHSKGHREAMLVASADQAGLGFDITEEDRVYAALELC